jgi:hypothetical protein
MRQLDLASDVAVCGMGTIGCGAKIMGKSNRLRDDDRPFHARGSRRLRNVLI